MVENTLGLPYPRPVTARLFNSVAPMADGGDNRMTAAEEVLTWLLVEKIGVPDDVSYSPDQSQKIIADRLSQSPSPQTNTDALEAIRRLSSLDDEISNASPIIMSRMADIHQHADAALAIAPAPQDHLVVKSLVWKDEKNFGDVPTYSEAVGALYTYVVEAVEGDTLDESKAKAEQRYEAAIRSAINPSPQTNVRTVAELPMTAFADAAPRRDESNGEQTILTYNDKVGIWDLAFFESGEEFPEKWFGDTHWIDITKMWPGVIAQVASFATPEGQPDAT